MIARAFYYARGKASNPSRGGAARSLHGAQRVARRLELAAQPLGRAGCVPLAALRLGQLLRDAAPARARRAQRQTAKQQGSALRHTPICYHLLVRCDAYA
ncbi:MAG: hypothetical protein VXW27_10100, partial [Pseudomonadota bacterium]|nr:hypothetical protein [Pseudomonadota bacterium]